MGDEKRFDVVLFGATGFTGKLIARYLNEHPASPSWAMAGRSKERLAKVRSDLTIPDSVGLIEVDSSRPDTLRTMARQAKCVINVVGPFRKLGAESVVEACLAEKAHYVDLSGETGFNMALIKRFHEQAKQAGIVVGPSVGFDSLPADLSTYLAVQHLKSKMDCPGAEEVTSALRDPALVSSGTVQSAIDMANEDKRQLQFTEAGKLATREPSQPLQFSGSKWLPQYDGYGGSYVLSPHNVRTVYRSWSLLEDAEEKDSYGPHFAYDDVLLGGRSLFSQLQSNAQKFSILLLCYVSPVRSILSRVLPEGGGPSEGLQKRSRTEVRTLARYGRKQALCTFKAPGDPGYSMTARMISETALALALDHDKLHPLGKQGGVLTAATIGAEVISERLQKYAQFEIKTEDFAHA